VRIQVLNLNFAMGEKDPLKLVEIYDSEFDTVPRRPTQSDIGHLVPIIHDELLVRVFCTRPHDDELCVALKRAARDYIGSLSLPPTPAATPLKRGFGDGARDTSSFASVAGADPTDASEHAAEPDGVAAQARSSQARRSVDGPGGTAVLDEDNLRTTAAPKRAKMTPICAHCCTRCSRQWTLRCDWWTRRQQQQPQQPQQQAAAAEKQEHADVCSLAKKRNARATAQAASEPFDRHNTQHCSLIGHAFTVLELSLARGTRLVGLPEGIKAGLVARALVLDRLLAAVEEEHGGVATHAVLLAGGAISGAVGLGNAKLAIGVGGGGGGVSLPLGGHGLAVAAPRGEKLDEVAVLLVGGDGVDVVVGDLVETLVVLGDLTGVGVGGGRVVAVLGEELVELVNRATAGIVDGGAVLERFERRVALHAVLGARGLLRRAVNLGDLPLAAGIVLDRKLVPSRRKLLAMAAYLLLC
jgi:hypothetical protein